MICLEKPLDLLRRICKLSAFDRFHDGDGFPVFSGNLIVRAGGDGRVFPVRVVDLKLDKINFRTLCQNPVEEFRSRVIGKAEMPDKALCFLFLYKIP